MRGGRNKFGPMYKYDRALRQQALRQRQLLLSHGLHPPHDHEMPPDFLSHLSGTPPDIKPDISQLSLTSKMPHEPVLAPADVSSSHGEFYRHGSDPTRVVTASASVGSYPAAALRVCQESYPPRPDHRQYSSMSYDYDVNTSVPFYGVTDVPVSRLTPLAGLSHMTNDVPNFVGQSPNSLLHSIYPATAQTRTYTSQPSHVPVSSYQLSVTRPPEELRRHSSMVPPSSFAAVLSESSPPFPPHQPLRSSQATVLTESPSSQTHLSPCVSDLMPSTSLPCPVTTFSPLPIQGLSQPGQQPSSRYSRTPSVFIAELRRNEPDQRDVQKKLSNILTAAVEEQRQRPQMSDDSPTSAEHIPMEPGAERVDTSVADLRQTAQLRQSMEVICKMCDQMLFMMVEWARGTRFFRELKVHSVGN